jgi:hypothetical protein
MHTSLPISARDGAIIGVLLALVVLPCMAHAAADTARKLDPRLATYLQAQLGQAETDLARIVKTSQDGEISEAELEAKNRVELLEAALANDDLETARVQFRIADLNGRKANRRRKANVISEEEYNMERQNFGSPVGAFETILARQGPVEFGPEVSRVVNNLSTGRDCFLNLETGAVLTPEEKLAGVESILMWSIRHGADLVGDEQRLPVAGGRRGVTLLGGWTCGSPAWEKATAEQIRLEMLVVSADHPERLDHPPVCPMVTTRSPQAPWAFKTRNGRLGMLQLLGLSDDGQGVKLRYKLVQPAPKGTATKEPPRWPPVLTMFVVASDSDTNHPTSALLDGSDRAGTNKLRILRDSPMVDSSDIGSARLAAPSGLSSNVVISVVLKESALPKLAQATAANVGRRMGVVGEGRVLGTSLIRAPMTQPELTIGCVLKPEEVVGLLQALNGWDLASPTSPPGGGTAAPRQPPALKCGPVIERVLENASQTGHSWIDLDSGKVFAPPSFTNMLGAVERWIEECRLDAVATEAANSQGRCLRGIQLVAFPIPKEGWDDERTLVEWRDALALLKPSFRVDLVAREPLPATFWFKTREGAMGVLQITAFTEQPPGLRVRYKLVQGQNLPEK